MAKIDLQNLVIDLEGKPIKLGEKEVTFGHAMAMCLVGGAKSSDPMRAYIMSQEVMKGDEVEFNQSDTEFLKTSIKAAENFTDIVKGQLLLALK